jgi:hypothetical protein
MTSLEALCVLLFGAITHVHTLPGAGVECGVEGANGEEERSVAENGSSVEQHAGRVARKASPWIGRLARVGYVAYGVVYVLVGVLSVRAALGGGDRATGQEGALRQVLHKVVVARYRRIEPV